jgi:dihydrofolate reductase
MTLEGVIGQHNTLPWSIPSDLERFRQLTIGHSVVMGRKTWESIPERFRPLPGRTNIVLTREEDYRANGAVVVSSIEQACIAAIEAPGADEMFVIGGAEIYRLFLPFVDKAYITEVYASIVGDVYFPDMPLLNSMRVLNWKCLDEVTPRKRGPRDEYPTTFKRLARTVV